MNNTKVIVVKLNIITTLRKNKFDAQKHTNDKNINVRNKNT